MLLKRLECQGSNLVHSDACRRPTAHQLVAAEADVHAVVALGRAARQHHDRHVGRLERERC
jgi:hypothetical protein